MDIDMKQVLEDTFKDDRIRKEIRINRLDEYLFTENILRLHPETTYSTVEAGEFIGRRDSTLRNYFRTELVDYIQPEKSGVYYRLDYKSIFKLHMILLLVEKANKTTADIAFYCGLSSLVSTSTNRQGNVPNTKDYSALELDVKQLKQGLVLQSINTGIVLENNRLLETKLNLSNVNNEIEILSRDIELLKLEQHTENVENKYHKMLDYSLKNTLAKDKEKSQWSFKRLFKGDVPPSEEEVEKVIKTSLEIADKEQKEYNKDQIKKLQSIIKDKMDEKQAILIEIEEGEKKLETMNQKLQNLHNNPNAIESSDWNNLS